MVALLRLAEAPELDLDALGRGLVRLSAIDQVLLGGMLMRMKHPNLAGLVYGGGSLLFFQHFLSSTRTHQTYLLFYIMSTLVLFGALLLNTYRILRRRIPEYAVHHLFGATQRFIFARMYLFVLGYHVIPLAGTLLILSLNRLASPLNLLMVFAATMGSAFLVTSIVQQRFVSKLSQGLRRE